MAAACLCFGTFVNWSVFYQFTLLCDETREAHELKPIVEVAGGKRSWHLDAHDD